MKWNLGEHIGLIGTTGSGKSTWAIKLGIPSFERALVIDTEKRQFKHLPLIKKNDPTHIMKALVATKEKSFHWRVEPPSVGKKEWMESLAQKFLDGPDLSMLLYMDEVTDFGDANYIPETQRALIREARKRKLTVMWGTQRPAGSSLWLRDNSPHMFFFFVKPDARKGVDKIWPGISDELDKIQPKTFRYIYLDPYGYRQLYEAVR